MSSESHHRHDNELDRLIPDGLSGPVAAATIDVLYRLVEAMESRYLAEILRDRHDQNRHQPDLWD
jgi:hypothetical protein